MSFRRGLYSIEAGLRDVHNGDDQKIPPRFHYADCRQRRCARADFATATRRATPQVSVRLISR